MRNKFWVNYKFEKIPIIELSDDYLKNILKFVTNGGGYVQYLNEKVLKNLFNEAEKRNLEHCGRYKDALNYLKIKKKNIKSIMLSLKYEFKYKLRKKLRRDKHSEK